MRQEKQQEGKVESGNKEIEAVGDEINENENKDSGSEDVETAMSEYERREMEKEKEEAAKDPSLVWYQVPELGLKFKVTPYAKKDLKYYLSGRDSAFFYRQSEIDFFNKFKEADPLNDCSDKSYCTLGAISVNSRSEGTRNRRCPGGTNIFEFDGKFVCFSGPQALHHDPEQEEVYNNYVKDKDFRYYLRTMEKIK